MALSALWKHIVPTIRGQKDNWILAWNSVFSTSKDNVSDTIDKRFNYVHHIIPEAEESVHSPNSVVLDCQKSYMKKAAKNRFHLSVCLVSAAFFFAFYLSYFLPLLDGNVSASGRLCVFFFSFLENKWCGNMSYHFYHKGHTINILENMGFFRQETHERIDTALISVR